MKPGDMLGPYRVLDVLGVGGMGEVYKARDTRLNRPVAIKVLPAAASADIERRARFEREAQAIAALNHPNIVTIHAVEEADGVPFFTMEYVDGKTLAQMILRPWSRAVRDLHRPPARSTQRLVLELVGQVERVRGVDQDQTPPVRCGCALPTTRIREIAPAKVLGPRD